MTVFGGSATWNLNPANGDWNTAANWSPATVPNGSTDVASFGVSNNTAISLSASATVNSLIFNPGASAFTITANPTRLLNITGVGIANNSGITQNFSAISNENAQFGMFIFSGSASAGDSNVFTNHGSKKPGYSSSTVAFTETSRAGTSTFINKADEVGDGPVLEFLDSSSADHGTFINESGNATGIFGGETIFFDNSTAGNGAFVLKGRQIAGAGGGRVGFFGTSTGGNGTFSCEGGAYIQFGETATGGNAAFTMNGGTVAGASGATAQFNDTATAGNGTFILAGGAINDGGLFLEPAAAFFLDTSKGGSATLTANGGTVAGAKGAAVLFTSNPPFNENPTAGNATLIANGGVAGAAGGAIQFQENSRGGTSRIEVFGNGSLDVSFRRSVTIVSIGSLEGDGLVFLGANTLAIGTNNLSTSFSGTAQDSGGIGTGTHGSLSKSGSGTLTLTGSNTYTGNTTVSSGGLVVNNTTGSGTGTSVVSVTGGTLGGKGTISGAVTVGTGSGAGAFLAPAFGGNKQVTLTLRSSLTLQADATYTYTFKARANQTRTDLVRANGVTINGATIALQGTTQGTLTPGTELTLIRNTSPNAIVGTFSNLAAGAIVTVNGNKLQASYEGGDGNDLTLTVVP